MDFFAHFRIFLWVIFDGHRLGNVSRSDLRWTSSPTSEFFLWAILDGHRLGNVFAERSSMDFFANFRIFLWAIFDAHQLRNFSRSDLRWTSSPTFEFFFFECIRIESISTSTIDAPAYHWCKRQASQVGSRRYSQQDLPQEHHFPQGGSKYNLLHLPCFARMP